MGKQWKQWETLFWGAPKSQCLLLGRKALTNIDSILKSRDINLPTKICLVKAVVFLVVIYGCESWIIKKTQLENIDTFELWWWRRLLRVPWTARKCNQSILKEIIPEYSLEGLMAKLKLQYFGHVMRRAHWKRPWSWDRLKAGGEGDDRGGDDWTALATRWTWVWVGSGDGDGHGSLVCCSPWGHKEWDITERLNRWCYWK